MNESSAKVLFSLRKKIEYFCCNSAYFKGYFADLTYGKCLKIAYTSVHTFLA